MKELNADELKAAKIQIEAVQGKDQDQQFKFLQSIRKKKGHKVFELNLDTQEIQEAEFHVEKVVDLNDALRERRKIIIKKNCLYIQALNEKNALRKVINGYHKAL